MKCTHTNTAFTVKEFVLKKSGLCIEFFKSKSKSVMNSSVEACWEIIRGELALDLEKKEPDYLHFKVGYSLRRFAAACEAAWAI